MGSEFDTEALSRRAFLWRIEAARAPVGPMRNYCRGEAEQCERRLRRSFETPVISGWVQAKASLQQLTGKRLESAAQLAEVRERSFACLRQSRELIAVLPWI